jgi:hypothetical protein
MNNFQSQSLVENCKFKFKCHKTWQSLEVKSTYAENRRYCNDCSQDVYLINNDFELESAILNNYCVAIPANSTIRFLTPTDPNLHTTLGILGPREHTELTDTELTELRSRGILKFDPANGLSKNARTVLNQLGGSKFTVRMYADIFLLSVPFVVILWIACAFALFFGIEGDIKNLIVILIILLVVPLLIWQLFRIRSASEEIDKKRY